MKILIISDSHGHRKFPLHEDIDVVCTLGDMTEDEMLLLAKNYPVPILSVYGNNDTLRQYNHDFITLLDGNKVSINGVTFGGVGGIPIYSEKRAFYLKSEEQVQKELDSLWNVDIMLSHANPMLPVSKDESDPDRGFFSFLRFMEFRNPKYWFHGHLHKKSETEFYSTKIHCVYTHQILHLP